MTTKKLLAIKSTFRPIKVLVSCSQILITLRSVYLDAFVKYTQNGNIFEHQISLVSPDQNLLYFSTLFLT